MYSVNRCFPKCCNYGDEGCGGEGGCGEREATGGGARKKNELTLKVDRMNTLLSSNTHHSA